MLAGSAGNGIEHIGKVIAVGGINNKSNKQERDDPHEKHDLLLFDDPRITSVFKDCVKTGQRMGEKFTRKKQRFVHRIEQTVVKGSLVMMSVLASLAKIFFRLLVESLLTTK